MTLFGVGRNSPGKFQAKVDGRNTEVYDIWRGMLRRCYSEEHLRRRPTYNGCAVEAEFLDFQEFAAWATQQIGFGLPGYQLDKDFLQPDALTYGPGHCVFIPADLNVFTTSNTAKRGKWPQGVSWKKRNRRFVAQIKAFGTVKHLGLFRDVQAASQAYAEAKTQAAREWAQQLRSAGAVVDPRVLEALENYQFKHRELS